MHLANTQTGFAFCLFAVLMQESVTDDWKGKDRVSVCSRNHNEVHYTDAALSQ